jgi:hypothetical protein
MSELRYLHFNNDQANRKVSKKQARANRSRTLAVASLSTEEVKNCVLSFASAEADCGEQVFLRMLIGIAVASIDDNYNRKIGRQLSSEEMKEVNLEVVGVTINQDHTFLHFAEYEGVKLAVRLNRKTGFSTVVGKMNDQQANKAK